MNEIDYKILRLRIWSTVVVVALMVLTILVTVLATNTYTVRFEMDNNTLEAVKSINFSVMNQKECMPVQIIDERNIIHYPGYPNSFNFSNYTLEPIDTSYKIEVSK